MTNFQFIKHHLERDGIPLTALIMAIYFKKVALSLYIGIGSTCNVSDGSLETLQ